MAIKFRQIAQQLRASYWFVPAVLSLCALCLSLLTLWIDGMHADLLDPLLSWDAKTTASGARDILATIGTGMISVSGTVFAITIAAVVYASGTYGPRLLFNFMNDRGNQFALGIFIATYLYCLLILRTIREGEGVVFVPQLSLLVAIALAVMSVGVLVYFLHHVPASIRINSVLANIGRQALRAVEARYPDLGSAEPLETEGPQDSAIVAKTCGYVELIDFDVLGDLAEKKDVKLHLGCRTGDFVQIGMTLVRVDGKIDDKCTKAIRDAFVYGSQRTADQDIEYQIDELVEIALRALSPSMNDPFTAISSLFWIGAVTGELAGRCLDRDPDGVKSSERGVYPLPDDFGHFLQRGFGGVLPSAATHPMAAAIFAQALGRVALRATSPARRGAIEDQLDRLCKQARLALKGPVLEQLETACQDVQAQLKRAGKE